MQKGIPKGWILSGSHPAEYEMGLDYEVVHQGKSICIHKSKRECYAWRIFNINANVPSG